MADAVVYVTPPTTYEGLSVLMRAAAVDMSPCFTLGANVAVATIEPAARVTLISDLAMSWSLTSSFTWSFSALSPVSPRAARSPLIVMVILAVIVLVAAARTTVR